MKFFIDDHLNFLLEEKNFNIFGSQLFSQKTWLLYWWLSSIEILGLEKMEKYRERIESLKILAKNQLEGLICSNGAFAGCLNGSPHILATFSAIEAIILLGKDYYKLIDRNKIYKYLMELKCENGSFYAHLNGGEIDIRTCYAGIALAWITGIMDLKIIDGCIRYIKKCRSYDGGFSGVPYTESHGGYTFCAIAAFSMIDETFPNEFYKYSSEAENSKILWPIFRVKEKIGRAGIDFKKTRKWIKSLQCKKTGGFKGRLYKKSDSCYSYWVMGILNTLNYVETNYKIKKLLKIQRLPISISKLLKFILKSAKCKFGGFSDRKRKGQVPDHYHTCNSLIGIAICQMYKRKIKEKYNFPETPPIHPYLGLPLDKVIEIRNYYISKPFFPPH